MSGDPTVAHDRPSNSVWHLHPFVILKINRISPKLAASLAPASPSVAEYVAALVEAVETGRRLISVIDRPGRAAEVARILTEVRRRCDAGRSLRAAHHRILNRRSPRLAELLVEYQRATESAAKAAVHAQEQICAATDSAATELLAAAERIRVQHPWASPLLLPPNRTPESGPADSPPYSGADIKWLYKRLTHLTNKNSMSADSHMLALCHVADRDDQHRPCLTNRPRFAGSAFHRLMHFEFWAITALCAAVGVRESDVDWTRPCTEVLHALRAHATGPAIAARLTGLASAVRELAKAPSAQTPVALTRAAKAFQDVTAVSGTRSTGRHQYFINSLLITDEDFRLDQPTSQAMADFGVVVGQITELVAAGLTEQISTLPSPPSDREILESAVDIVARMPGTADRPPRPLPAAQAVMFGIDFGLAKDADSRPLLIPGDVNLFPAGPGILCDEIARRWPEGGQSVLPELLAGDELSVIVDDEAWRTNVRWAREVAAVARTCAGRGIRVSVHPFVVGDPASLNRALDQATGRAAIWFVRDGYFKQPVLLHRFARCAGPLNTYAFCYVQEDRRLVSHILRAAQERTGWSRLRIRRDVVADLTTLMRATNAAMTDHTVDRLGALYLHLRALGMDGEFFVKPVKGKDFRPFSVCIAVPLSLRNLRNNLIRLAAQGHQELVLEEAMPDAGGHLVTVDGSAVVAELRTLLVRRAEQNVACGSL